MCNACDVLSQENNYVRVATVTLHHTNPLLNYILSPKGEGFPLSKGNLSVHLIQKTAVITDCDSLIKPCRHVLARQSILLRLLNSSYLIFPLNHIITGRKWQCPWRSPPYRLALKHDETQAVFIKHCTIRSLRAGLDIVGKQSMTAKAIRFYFSEEIICSSLFRIQTGKKAPSYKNKKKN